MAGYALVGLDGQFLEVSDELCRILGRCRSDLLNRNVVDITDPRDRERSLAAGREAMASGRSVALTKRFAMTDGTVKTVFTTSRLLPRQFRGESVFFTVTREIDHSFTADTA